MGCLRAFEPFDVVIDVVLREVVALANPSGRAPAQRLPKNKCGDGKFAWANTKPRLPRALCPDCELSLPSSATIRSPGCNSRRRGSACAMPRSPPSIARLRRSGSQRMMSDKFRSWEHSPRLSGSASPHRLSARKVRRGYRSCTVRCSHKANGWSLHRRSTHQVLRRCGRLC